MLFLLLSLSPSAIQRSIGETSHSHTYLPLSPLSPPSLLHAGVQGSNDEGLDRLCHVTISEYSLYVIGVVIDMGTCDRQAHRESDPQYHCTQQCANVDQDISYHTPPDATKEGNHDNNTKKKEQAAVT